MFIDLQKSQGARRLNGQISAQRPRTKTMTTTAAIAVVKTVESTAAVVATTETTRAINNNNNSEVTKTITTNIQTNTDICTMNYFGIDTSSIDAFKYFLFS